MVCTILFLAADIISEFGVSSSSTCSPQRLFGQVTTSNDSSNAELDDADAINLKRATIFAQMQTIPFIEGELTLVPSGFPADVNANVCTKCLETADRPVILGDCTVRDGRKYAPGELTVVVEKSSTLLKTVSLGFRESSTTGTPYMGTGDVVKQQTCTIFSFHIPDVNNTSNATLTYFEYANDTHCEQILDASKRKDIGSDDEDSDGDGRLAFRTEGVTYTQEIRCAKNLLRGATFRNSVSLFRSLQLEFSLHRPNYNNNTERFRKIVVNDVYRSGIAAMLTNGDFDDNEYFEYTDCGQYHWVFIIPFLTLLTFLSFIAMICAMFVKGPIPVSMGKQLPVISPSKDDDLEHSV